MSKKKFRTLLIGCKTLSVEMLHSLMKHPKFEVVGVITKDHWEDMEIWHEIGEERLDTTAEEYGLKVYRLSTVNDVLLELVSLELDYIFIASWPEIVNKTIIELPRIGCFNIHIAALPMNRGCMPIHWAIINGEPIMTTIHKLSSGVDNGHIVIQMDVPKYIDDNARDLWKRAMDESAELFEFSLDGFANLNFTLHPQNEKIATHHPRGLPYAGQMNPYWEQTRRERFAKAMDFPPFENRKPDVQAIMDGQDKPSVRIAMGFDVDAPRGPFIASGEGNILANNVRNTLFEITAKINDMNISLTHFVCGEFLESMKNLYYNDSTLLHRMLIGRKPRLIEIADHTYYHSAIKQIPTRPDRPSINSFHVMHEWEKNTRLFRILLGLDIEKRGFRAPYGYFEGLKGKDKLLRRLRNDGVLYVSSDLRDQNHNVYGHLTYENGKPRQPYRYENGLLEIPSHGWQDTALIGGKTPVVKIKEPPRGIDKICKYYENLISDAHGIAQMWQRDFFLSFTLHPHAIMYYDPDLETFDCMAKKLEEIDGSFITHEAIYRHYGSI